MTQRTRRASISLSDTTSSATRGMRMRRRSESDADDTTFGDSGIVPLREDAQINALDHLTKIVILPTRRCYSLAQFMQTLRVKLRFILARLMSCLTSLY